MYINKKWFVGLIAFGTLLTAQPMTLAQVLTGSGDHLPIPNPNPGSPLPSVPYTIASSSGTGCSGTTSGQWLSPAATPWLGTFTGTNLDKLGSIASNPCAAAATVEFNFASLNDGSLPAGTYFNFGDVDAGSGSEIYTLSASNNTGAITTPWLNVPVGAQDNTPAPIVLSSMPGWSFNATNGTYTIDGNTVPGNPVVAFTLTNNVNISSLSVTRNNPSNSLYLSAPIVIVPESSNILGLGAVAGLGLISGLKRKLSSKK